MTSNNLSSAVFVDAPLDGRSDLQEQNVPQDFSILIVEDDEDTRNNLADILSLDGYKIQTESHCLLAISAVENGSFDAVIVDWRLPDSNADELIPIIVKYQPNTPVVVVTGMREFDTAVKALRSGAYDFLLKPINPDALRSVMRRIGERKQHLAEIGAGQKKLLMNERLAAIGQMVTGLAHESRNAFQRSHACLAELALDLSDRPDSLELVRKVQKALDDLHFLLEEVRDYSAPIILERRPCCLESLIRETWQDILLTKKVDVAPKLRLEKVDGVPSNCLIDVKRMQQVMRNLLENAVFACTEQGEVQVRLSFAKGKQSLIRIEVSDDGKGVPVDQRETIFAPFYTTKTKGTGLGLAVARRFIDAHDGRICVDVNYTRGARFVVELPQYRR